MKPVSNIGKRRKLAKDDSSASYDARRKEIAEASIRVFNRWGFKGASMSAVAAELDIDRASLYYYFSSKEELFDQLVRAVVERNLEIIKQIESSGASASRKLRDLVNALMTSYGDNYPLFYIYIRENLSHVSDDRTEWSKSMRKINAETVDAVISIIETGYADNSLRKVGSARVVAYGILGIVGWTHRWFRPDQSDISAEEIGKTYAELLLAGLESPYGP
jgi:AcrR family transcriptional regulator